MTSIETEVLIGRRVAYWRGRRNMSQQVFADRLGKSKSWVDKVERGVRRLDKLSVLHEVADVLRIDVGLLLGREPQRRDTLSGVNQVEMEAVRAALERYRSLLVPTVDPDLPPLADLRKSMRHAWLALQHARYSMLTRTLPVLLRQAEDVDAAQDSDESAHLLGQVYQIASSVLRKLGKHELAWITADRAVSVSQRSGDQLLSGVATSRVGLAILALGRPRAAMELHIGMSTHLAPDSHQPTPQQMSVHGHLLLQAAIAAARLGDNTTVTDLFARARKAADLIGSDQNHYWTSFGPTDVLLHRAAAYVELGEGGRAVEIDRQIPPDRFNALVPERRAHHLLDLARGFAQIGDMERAGVALLRGDQLAPAEIRSRPIAHELMSDILRRAKGTLPAPVAALAERMKIGV